MSAFSCRRTDILPSDLSGLLLPIFHHLHSQEIDLECLFLIAQKRRKKSIYEMNLKVRNPYIRKNYSVCTDLLFRMYGNIIPYVRIYFPVCTELCTESLFRTYGNIIPYVRICNSVCTETLFRTEQNISSGGGAASRPAAAPPRRPPPPLPGPATLPPTSLAGAAPGRAGRRREEGVERVGGNRKSVDVCVRYPPFCV